MILLLLLLLTATAYAQECHPTVWEYPPELRGCPNILKVQKTQVTFPGQTPRMVVQYGSGQCAKNASCDPILYTLGLTGTKECWPEFLAPERSWGHWSREVIDSKIGMGLAGTCSQKTGDHIEQVPLLGPKCERGERHADKEEFSCQIAGAGDGSYNPSQLPLPLPDPSCVWDGLIAGFPCSLY